MLRSIALLLLLCQVTEAQDNLSVQDLFEPMPTPKHGVETPAAVFTPATPPVAKQEDWQPKLHITLMTSPKGISSTHQSVSSVFVSEPAYKDIDMLRGNNPVTVQAVIEKRSLEEVTESVSVPGLNQMLCDDFKMSMEATEAGTQYSFESTGRLVLQRQGSSIEAESGSYSNGKLKLLNAKIKQAGMTMEADTLIISITVFGVSTLQFPSTQPVVVLAPIRYTRPQPSPGFITDVPRPKKNNRGTRSANPDRTPEEVNKPTLESRGFDRPAESTAK